MSDTERLTSEVCFELRRTHEEFESLMTSAFRTLGLTVEQFRVLTVVCDKGPVNVSDIARRLSRSPNSATMIVDRMVKTGLVRRVRLGRDRRIVHVFPTRRAEAVLPAAMAKSHELTQAVSVALQDEAKQTLVELLGRLQCRMVELRPRFGWDKK